MIFHQSKHTILTHVQSRTTQILCGCFDSQDRATNKYTVWPILVPFAPSMLNYSHGSHKGNRRSSARQGPRMENPHKLNI